MDSAATGLDGISRPSGHATALPSNTEFPPSQAERGRPPLGSLPPVSDQRVTTLRLPSGKVIWDLFLEGFGPLKTVAAACDEKRRKELERDFVVFHDRFRNDLGVAMPREYLVSVGVRK